MVNIKFKGIPTLKLIKLVQEREVLWDMGFSGYNNRYKRAKYWKEIAAIVGANEEKVRKKWKNLKDTFRREAKKCEGSEWKYFVPLHFLATQYETGGFPVEFQCDDQQAGLDGQDESEVSGGQRVSSVIKPRVRRKSLCLINVEQLIELVRERNVVWDRSHLRHHHSKQLECAWNEIAQALGTTKENARLKWKNIRDTARKEHRKPESSWVHLPKLDFLQDQYTLTEEDVEDAGEDYLASDFGNVEEPYGVQAESAFVDMGSNQCKMGLMDVSETVVDRAPRNRMEVDVIDPNSDEDVAFFNSILPHVKKLAPMEKMKIRMRIQQLVFDEVYNSGFG